MIHEHDRGRNHVRRQELARELAQHLQRAGVPITDQIGDDALVGGRPQHGHERFTYGRVPHEHRLDFAQLNAEATNLHLIVGASEILQILSRQEPREIAGAIQRFAGAERMRQKARGSELRTVQIARSDASAANVDLAWHADRNSVAEGVEQVNFEIGNLSANDAATREIFLRDWPVCHVHGRLGDPVHVDQLGPLITVPIEPRAQAFQLQRFATENHISQRQQRRGAGAFLGCDEQPERRRCLVEHRNAFGDEKCVEVIRRSRDVMWHGHHATTIQQRTPDLPDGEVESERMEQSPDVLFVEVVVLIGGRHQAHHVSVRDATAFWLSRRSGCEDYVGQIIRISDDMRR